MIFVFRILLRWIGFSEDDAKFDAALPPSLRSRWGQRDPPLISRKKAARRNGVPL